MTITKLTCIALGLAASSIASAADPILHSFQKFQLDEHFWSEGAAFGDFNKDGKMDIVSGPFWYEGPDFKTRHEFYPAKQTFKRKKDDGTEETLPGFEGALGVNNVYSDNFFAFTRDFNGDGWPDILIYGFPGKDASWFENPQGKEGPWKRHLIFAKVDNESPAFADLNGDGKPDIVCNSGGFFGYATQESDDPAQPWKFHPISQNNGYGQFTHGLGLGDVNGDGRADVIEGSGWWEQPASLAGDPVWEKHGVNLGGGAQFYAYDVNGDGLADIVGSVAAHGYGVAWWEQMKEGGRITFRKHLIVGQKPEENRYGVVFSQPHAVELVDIDGDGLKDIVTGKRFWAHGNHGDADPNAAAVIYWFKLVRNGKSVDFVPHLIDDNSGVGTQVVVGDVNGDALPDIVVGNKKGTFVHIAQKKAVSQEAWDKAQPKPNPAYVEPGAAPAPAAAPAATSGPIGTLPLGKDGKPLNLDFEDGTLRDWTATGEAFKGQPYKGPIDQNRDFGEGKFANHQGSFWIGGYELLKDAPTGTLASAAFKVTQPYAAFRLGGGVMQGERLELVNVETGKVFFTAHGSDSETMLPVVVDLQSMKDKEISIRLVDELSGGWGHINFDDFRFYDKKPEFANAAPPIAKAAALPADVTKFAGLSPEEAVKAMTLPPGFAAKLYAGEPDVKQPIAFAIDDRGRIWVAEAYSYPKRQPEGEGKDRILVFEDVNGDGKFDKRTVFMEGLNLVSGLEVGFGGVWVGAAPYLMFIPMKNGDEPRPSGPPQILLDGFGYGDTHETLNTFTWGPDGWLYGCHGVFTFSNAGKPGAPDSERTKINAGVWRYHPTKHKFELFAEGTSNPWGIDFDEHGQCITEGCVIPHLWHMIQNAHYQRQGGQHFNPNVFDDIKTIADHVHWVGGSGPHAGNGKSDSAGGGHAHAGLMVYLGGSWPAQYRGQAFMNNIHGARLNVDILEQKGSGFAGHHGADFMMFNDLWSQIVNLQYDQDGSVFLIDWYDKNQCHNNDVNAHDRTNGRIFKVVYSEQKTTRVDLEKLSNAELIALQLNANDWHVRHARRILQERGPNPEVHAALRKMLVENPDPARRLRALWALHATGGLTEEIALAALNEKDQYLRAWTIQLLCENGQPSQAAVQEFGRLAKTDPSAVVRLYIASAAQRIAPEQRWEIATALHGHAEDAADHNLPLMGWYALESLAPSDLNRTLAIALDSKLPRILEFTSRRLAGLNGGLDALAAALQATDDAPRQLAILTGISTALKGQRTVAEPKGWAAVETKLGQVKNDIRTLSQSLSLTFGSSHSLDATRLIVANPDARPRDRLAALDSLLNIKDAALPPVLLKLIRNDAELRAAALRGLAVYADPKTPETILAVYSSLPAPEKRDAMLTLASRPAYAAPLLAAIGDGRIPARDVSADIARQIRGLNDNGLTQQLEKVWGTTKESSADRLQAQAKYKTLVLAKNPPVNAGRGRALFNRTCIQCHTLFNEGGKIGPDITGANRNDIDYLLHNILDPNAEIPNQYRTTILELKEGRVLAGIANQQDPKVITVASINETVIIPRSEIKTITVSDFSMMPEGLLTQFSDQEVRDLLAYLQTPAQVPLP